MATSTQVNTQIIVNFEDKFTESASKAMETYKRCMEDVLQLQKKSEQNAPPPLNVGEEEQSLEFIKSCLEQIQSMQDNFVTVNLVDNASEEAKRIRGEIEKVFSQDITQRVTIAEKTIKTAPVVGTVSRASDSFFGEGPEFLTSSKNLTGFGNKVDTSPKIKVGDFPAVLTGFQETCLP